MINLVKKYLEEKINYIYFEKGKTSLSEVQKQLTDLAMNSRLSSKDLSASDCYILYQYNTNKLEYKKLTHKKNSTYNTFNLNINKLLLSITEKDKICNDNYNLNIAIYLLINDLSQELTNPTNIFDLFFDKDVKNNSSKKEYMNSKCNELEQILKASNIKEFITDLENPQKYKFDIISDASNRKEFAEEYIRSLKNKINKIEYFAIFYPCEFKHDFFAKKYYEVEISPIKFYKKNDELFKFVKNFYNDMGINTDLQKNIYRLEEYFQIPYFNLNICCFDPFINIEKYHDNYIKMKNDFIKNKNNFDEFIDELFMFLDTMQLSTITNQFENLFKSMSMKRTKFNTRKKSVREYIKDKLKENNSDEDNLIYQILDGQNPKLIYNKNTDLKKLNLINYENISYEKIQRKYIQILEDLNLDETSTLKYDYSKFIIMFDNDFADFQLSKTTKLIIHKMILDLITFYNDNEKLSSSFNYTFKKILDKYKNKKLTDLIDEKNIPNFIEKYKNEFNKYYKINKICPEYGQISTFIGKNNIEYIEINKDQIECLKKNAQLLNFQHNF